MVLCRVVRTVPFGLIPFGLIPFEPAFPPVAPRLAGFQPFVDELAHFSHFPPHPVDFRSELLNHGHRIAGRLGLIDESMGWFESRASIGVSALVGRSQFLFEPRGVIVQAGGPEVLDRGDQMGFAFLVRTGAGIVEAGLGQSRRECALAFHFQDLPFDLFGLPRESFGFFVMSGMGGPFGVAPQLLDSVPHPFEKPLGALSERTESAARGFLAGGAEPLPQFIEHVIRFVGGFASFPSRRDPGFERADPSLQFAHHRKGIAGRSIGPRFVDGPFAGWFRAGWFRAGFLHGGVDRDRLAGRTIGGRVPCFPRRGPVGRRLEGGVPRASREDDGGDGRGAHSKQTGSCHCHGSDPHRREECRTERSRIVLDHPGNRRAV